MSSPVENNNNTGAGDLSDKVAAQGDLVRKLKGDKKPKEEITAAVQVLLALKVRAGNILIKTEWNTHCQGLCPKLCTAKDKCRSVFME